MLFYKRKDIIVFIIVTIVFCLPIMTNLCTGDDFLFHINRLQGIKEALQSRNLLFIYPYHNFEFGYGCPLFYCDLFLLPFGALYALGCPVIICYKLIFIVFTIIGNYLMFYTLRYIYIYI